MPTLLVLAASEHQLPVIRAAKQLGVRVLTTDNVPDNPGHALADAAFNVDTTDVPAVLELARSQRIDGIVAACTDVAVITAARVSDALGLPGISPLAADTLTDKIAFRRFMDGFSQSDASWVELGADRSAADTVLRHGPSILKPARSSGSKGIFVVRDRAEFDARIGETLRFCPDGRAVLESFHDGFQGTVEGVLQGGEVSWALVTRRLTAPLPYCATWGHIAPSGLDAASRAELLATVVRLLATFDIGDGPFDADFVVVQGDIHVLEISPRLGGNALSSLAMLAAGVDLPKFAVRHALALPARLRPRPTSPAAALLLGVDREGTLSYDQAAADRLRALPWVAKLTIDLPVGASVRPFVNGTCRIGEALISATTARQLQQHIDTLRAELAMSAGV